MTPRPPATAPFVVSFDGASRGNPGPSSYGVFSPTSGAEIAQAIGVTTNNVAEWRGFLAALDLAIASGASDVEIRADSQLVLRQFQGEYRMKAAHLAGFLAEARRKAAKIPRLVVVHVPREKNRQADALANRALDAVTPAPAPAPAPPAAQDAAPGPLPAQGSLFPKS